MTNRTKQIEDEKDYARYIQEHLEMDLETNRKFRGELGALVCVAGQAFLMSSALMDYKDSEDIRQIWISVARYGQQMEIDLSETQKAILAIRRLNDNEWTRVFNYISEYSGKK